VSLSLVVAVGIAACGDDAGSASGASGPTTTVGGDQPEVRGHLTVFAAASLTDPFDDAQPALEAHHPGLHLTFSFAGSGALVTQIQQGAPADVVATADLSSMEALRDAGLVEAPVTFARNSLEILVAPGNPHHITGLADLAGSDLEVVLADDTVPAGKYAAQALRAAGVTVRPVSKEVDVRAAVAKVTSGEADATIVYVTDVTAAGRRGQGVLIPADQNVVAEYPIAVVRASPHHDAAEAFVDAAVSGDVSAALERRGFRPGA
jgi:molybdate transport system substrate-binding protein